VIFRYGRGDTLNQDLIHLETVEFKLPPELNPSEQAIRIALDDLGYIPRVLPKMGIFN
jgi:hypothetical protein